MIPTLGRIVHYTSGGAEATYPPEQRAALVTCVKNRRDPGQLKEMTEVDFIVDLHIFARTWQSDMEDVPFSREYKDGHWTWPPKV